MIDMETFENNGVTMSGTPETITMLKLTSSMKDFFHKKSGTMFDWLLSLSLAELDQIECITEKVSNRNEDDEPPVLWMDIHLYLGMFALGLMRNNFEEMDKLTLESNEEELMESARAVSYLCHMALLTKLAYIDIKPESNVFLDISDQSKFIGEVVNNLYVHEKFKKALKVIKNFAKQD